MLAVELNITDNTDAHAGEKVYNPKAFWVLKPLINTQK